MIPHSHLPQRAQKSASAPDASTRAASSARACGGASGHMSICAAPWRHRYDRIGPTSALRQVLGRAYSGRVARNAKSSSRIYGIPSSVTGSRADYGLLRGILTRLNAMDDVSLSIIACGMHLVPRFGETWRAIEADGFSIAAKIDLQLSDDRAETVARGTGIGVSGFAEVLPQLAPDVLVVLGDRYEVLAAAVAATLLNIPIAHIHGGEKPMRGRA